MINCSKKNTWSKCKICIFISVIVYFFFGVFLYYLPEIFRVIKGEGVEFNLKFDKIIIPIFFYFSGIIWALYLEIKSFNEKQKIKKLKGTD